MSQLVILVVALSWLFGFYWLARNSRQKGLWIGLAVWLIALSWTLFHWLAADYDIARAVAAALLFNHLIFGLSAAIGWIWGVFRYRREHANYNSHRL